MDEELRKDIEAVLNLFVRPVLNAHKGDVEVLDLDENGILWVDMLGECAGCPSNDDTAKGVIEKELTKRFPQIKCVEIDSGLADDIIAQALGMMNGEGKKRLLPQDQQHAQQKGGKQ